MFIAIKVANSSFGLFCSTATADHLKIFIDILSARLLRCGISALQGGHQVAKKTIKQLYLGTL
jgi:hypothetical protein